MSHTPLASRLEGLTIENWKVIKKRIKTIDDHSGAFSSGYEVQNIKDGRCGFLKAMNYDYAFKVLKPGISSTVFLQELTENYNYEKELLEFCKEKRMSRIVAANLPDIYKPFTFGGTFEDAKPHVMQAYYKTIDEIKNRIDVSIRKELIEIISQLTHPVPEERGLPKGKGFFTSLPQYSLDRYISIIDRLAKKIELTKK